GAVSVAPGAVPVAAGAESLAPGAVASAPGAVAAAPGAVPAAPAADDEADAPPADSCPAAAPFDPATFAVFAVFAVFEGSPRSPSPPPPPPPHDQTRNRPTESAATPRMLDCMPVWYGERRETGRTGVRRHPISGGNFSLEVAARPGAANRERAG